MSGPRLRSTQATTHQIASVATPIPLSLSVRALGDPARFEAPVLVVHDPEHHGARRT